MAEKRVALVTGASAGIGKSIVRRLLQDGWTVYGAARRVDKMEDIAAEGAIPLQMDVSDDASMQAALEALLDAEARLDALVNNAGYGSYGALEEVPIEEARRQFEVNVFGAMRLAQLVIPTMREQATGTIVNITSMGGRIWMPVGGWYHATKHALEVLSDTLRVEVAKWGIRVVVIQPGAIRSEWSDIAADTLDQTSEGSLYPELIGPMSSVLRNYSSAAPPEVVADAVSRALATPSPARRYAIPFQSKLLIFVHQFVPTWVWERLLRSTLR